MHIIGQLPTSVFITWCYCLIPTSDKWKKLFVVRDEWGIMPITHTIPFFYIILPCCCCSTDVFTWFVHRYVEHNVCKTCFYDVFRLYELKIFYIKRTYIFFVFDSCVWPTKFCCSAGVIFILCVVCFIAVVFNIAVLCIFFMAMMALYDIFFVKFSNLWTC